MNPATEHDLSSAIWLGIRNNVVNGGLCQCMVKTEEQCESERHISDFAKILT